MTEPLPYVIVTDWNHQQIKSNAISSATGPVWDLSIELKPKHERGVSLVELSSYPLVNVEVWGKNQVSGVLLWLVPASSIQDHPVGSCKIDVGKLMEASEEFETSRWVPLKPANPANSRSVGSIRVAMRGYPVNPALSLNPALPKSSSTSPASSLATTTTTTTTSLAATSNVLTGSKTKQKSISRSSRPSEASASQRRDFISRYDTIKFTIEGVRDHSVVKLITFRPEIWLPLELEENSTSLLKVAKRFMLY